MPNESDDVTVEAKGFKIPLPRWGLNSLVVLALIGLAGYGVWWAVGKWERDKIRISPAEKLELSLAARYLGEEPAKKHVAYDDERGALKMLEFSSGDAVAIRRIGRGPQQSKWFPDPANATAPPKYTLAPDWTLSDPAYASGQCVWPHGGRFVDRPERLSDECWIAVHRDFEDGCAVTWLRNVCYGYDEVDGNGNVNLRWRRCQH